MPHGQSWLNYIPGYDALAHWLHGFGHGWLFHEPIHAQHVAALLLVLLFMFVLAMMARSGLNRAKGDILPDGRFTARNFMELLMEGVMVIMQFAMPRKAAIRHFWLIAPLAMFILFSNLLGLIPGFLPPTESFNTTFACGSVVFIYYNFYAFKKLGMGHIAHMANPMGEPIGWVMSPLFIVVEVVSHCIRPVSLSVRLLCNIAGDHLVLAVFVGILPFLLPIPFMALGLFVALVQTFVFILLSSVYIGEVEANIEHHEHAHAHAHGQQAHAH
ncbi:MAG: F0F1 ATP synthase subunit A [Myxococcales bacterium]|nr:F0F1 ATP synthase subunit A [Myxococcales bacterium]MCB9650405.1 F0F1 ATP synthase subunit A [Deltaproteobacteria bacterium]